MFRKNLMGAVLVSAVLLPVQPVSAQDKMWECYKPCYDHYTQLIKKASTQQEKDRILDLRDKCTQDCWPGGKGFVPQNPIEGQK